MPNQHVTELMAIGMLALGITTGTVLTDQELAFVLHTGLEDTNTEDSFDTAKEHVYNDIDLDSDQVFCVYSGTVVTLEQQGDGSFHPREEDGIQVEHTWASKANWVDDSLHFERDSIPGADLHHLFPARRGPNGSRGNHPFGDPVSEVRALLLDDDGTLHQPEEGPGGQPTGSLRGLDAGGKVVFMPPEEHRGNVARAMFYMSVRYWWEIPEDMEGVLRAWHEDDPVDSAETARNERVEGIQNNRNPFIDDPTLVEQILDF